MIKSEQAQHITDWFFHDQGASLLGQAAGLDTETARKALSLGLPRQLQAVSDHAQTPQGWSQIAQAVQIIPRFSSVRDALNSGNGAADLDRAGEKMAPTLLSAARDDLITQLSAETGSGVVGVQRLLSMTLPLILSRLGWRDGAARGVLPALAGLGSDVGAAGAVGAAASSWLAHTDNAAVRPGNAATPVVTLAPGERRGGAFPLWILPLLLLLGLGGCWTLIANRDKTQTAGGQTATAAQGIVVTAPKANDTVSAGGFNISGTGKAGDQYQVFEDGTSIGTFKVGDDGNWTIDVPGPTPGNHTYTVQNAGGEKLLDLPLVVKAGDGTAACTEAPTISLGDNETVSAPFRFGGKGSAKAYTVTVWRGDRQVGTKPVTLTADCTWSYSSNPGGKKGQTDAIRYEVRPSDQTGGDPAVQATLNVQGNQ